MKPIVFHSEAKAELDEAMAYYENRCTGLGLELLSSVETALRRIESNPKMYSVYQSTAFRKCVVERFPFLVFYRELDEYVWVVAVAHSKRKPGYWMNRTPEE